MAPKLREKAAGERLELERVKQEIERDEKLAAQRVVAEKVRLERIMVENVKEMKGIGKKLAKIMIKQGAKKILKAK